MNLNGMLWSTKISRLFVEKRPLSDLKNGWAASLSYSFCLHTKQQGVQAHFDSLSVSYLFVIQLSIRI
jgi:hypothetical protein